MRLTDAGLGCPDWPGCYGQLIDVPSDETAQARYPDWPLDAGKAGRELAHRYLAGFLGLLILAVVVSGWRTARRGLLLALAGVVVLQVLLGMWTVTLLLQPLIVVLHLLGGFAVLAVLWWLCLDRRRIAPPQKSPLLNAAYGGIFLLLLQIALGGWTSANYAALACPDFPLCQGEWWPRADFAGAFAFDMREGVNYEHGVLEHPARTAIHLSHRLGAAVVAAFLAVLLASVAARSAAAPVRRAVAATAVALFAQLMLGVLNVLLVLPLPLAVAHNGAAALLLVCMLSLVRSLQSAPLTRRV